MIIDIKISYHDDDDYSKVILISFPAPLLYCYVCDDCPNTLSPLRHMAACPDSSHVSCITTLTTFAEFKSKFFLLFIGTITIIINCIIPVPIPITTLDNIEQFQTWNLSKILHRRIFRPKILHRQFHLISTVLVRKNTKNE